MENKGQKAAISSLKVTKETEQAINLLRELDSLGQKVSNYYNTAYSGKEVDTLFNEYMNAEAGLRQYIKNIISTAIELSLGDLTNKDTI